ncbi:MAG TPA: class I SAM-dependent methyltransferase [Pirellulaceae bacterium]|nr:class I SAM-dependent methyltransferase [Pirellulaceae bacterium]
MVNFVWDWLAHPDIDELIVRIAEAEPHEDWTKTVQRLRKQLTADEARQVLEQAELRRRARSKFPMAHRLWLTRRGLEQSTSATIATYKAETLGPAQYLADLCCGIGGDAMALGQIGHVLAVDRDTEMATIVNHNLSVTNVNSYAVRCDVMDQIDLSACDAVHVDPDRRSSGRTISPDRFDPPLADILARLGRHRAGIKVAPASHIDADVASDCHREWIGHDRECKQQMLWMNVPDRPSGLRSATVIDSTGSAHRLTPHGRNDAQPLVSLASRLGEFVIEPHNAVTASGLSELLANQISAERLDLRGNLLTADSAMLSPFYAVFHVLEMVPLRFDRIVASIEHYRLGPIEWKKNGLDVGWWSAAIKKHFDGQRPGSVICTRYRDRHVAIIGFRSNSVATTTT